VAQWKHYVQEITRGQVLRGVPDKSGMAIADFMMNSIYELVERELAGEQNKKQRQKFRQRLEALHSLGRVTILVTQIKTRENLPLSETP
jgi:hypothetical protein